MSGKMSILLFLLYLNLHISKADSSISIQDDNIGLDTNIFKLNITTENDLLIFKRESLQFPLSDSTIKSIIKNHLDLRVGGDDTFRSWQENVVMYFSRNEVSRELFISPDDLTNEEWIFISEMIKWAYKNKESLANSRYIVKNYDDKNIHGYFHEGEYHSFLLLRNPFVAPDKITIGLNDLMESDITSEYLVEQIYPCKRYMSDILSLENSLTLSLEKYEVSLYKLIPMDSVDYPIISGLVFRNQNDMEIYVDPMEIECVKIFNRDKITNIYLNNIELSTDELERYFCKQNKYEKFSLDTAVQFNSIGKDGISGSSRFAEQSGKFKPNQAILLEFSEPVDYLQISTNLECMVTKKGNHERWYWLLFPKSSQVDEIKFRLLPEDDHRFPHGRISIWALGELNLIAAGNLKIVSVNTMPEDNYFPYVDGTRSDYSMKLIEKNF